LARGPGAHAQEGGAGGRKKHHFREMRGNYLTFQPTIAAQLLLDGA
jgi:hypothetical protein